MRLTRPERKRSSRRGEAVILFSIAGTSFAVAVSAVEEIRSTEGLRPAPPGFAGSRLPKVKYMLERERKTYFVVDSNLHFHILPSRATRVLILRHAPVAVLVDNIERTSEITTLHALPQAFECRWSPRRALRRCPPNAPCSRRSPTASCRGRSAGSA